MEISDFDEQDDLIVYIQNTLENLQNAKSKEEKNRHMINLISSLISSSEEIAEKQNYYEAAGRLYSAAYYLEEYYPKEAKEVYEKVNEYYEKYYKRKIREGAINEAANIALKIAKIYEKKIQNPEKEKEFVKNAIGLIANQIEILKGIGSTRELAGKFQTLATLYKKTEEWKNVIISTKSALEYAKNIKEYSIILNSYKNLAKAYEEMGKMRKSENTLFQALDYFSKAAADHESKEELLQLSQLYQIIKNLNAELRNPRKYKIYSRKEAGVYISMAKLSLLYDTSDTQTAAYYRAAGLCYQETNQNYLDGASCFLLAAKHYEKGDRDMEAGLNYEDAAKNFERTGRKKKAYEYFTKAGKKALEVNNMQSAIENFMWAYDIAQAEGYEREKLTTLLFENLNLLAKIEEAAENYFVSATLQLEALYYKVKADEITKKTVEKYLNRILKQYWKAIEHNNVQMPSVRSYTYALATILSKILNNKEKYREGRELLENVKSKTGSRYLTLVDTVKDVLAQNGIVRIKDLPERLLKLLDSSEEIKIALKLSNKYNSL